MMNNDIMMNGLIKKKTSALLFTVSLHYDYGKRWGIGERAKFLPFFLKTNKNFKLKFKLLLLSDCCLASKDTDVHEKQRSFCEQKFKNGIA